MTAELRVIAWGPPATPPEIRGGQGELLPLLGRSGFPLTDLGNAERLVARHGADLRYVRQWGEMVWDGKRWTLDTTGEFTRRAKDTVRAMVAEAGALPDHERQALIKHSLASESTRAIAAMQELAKTERAIAATPEMFDRDPFLINVANGTLDLRTQQLREHRRNDLITKFAPVAFDPDAKCPRWERFLDDVMDGREEMVAFLKRAIGYALTGDTREQKFLFLYGRGGNGKGALTRTIEKMLGDYYRQASFVSFLETRRNAGAATPDLARLIGARCVAASESNGVQRLDEGLIKTLVGEDTMPVRLLYREQFDFRATFKLLLIANEKPTIRGTDNGIWRRLLLVPFTVTIPEDRVDHTLEPTLQGEELAGVFRWAVEGCAQWLERGLAAPGAVRAATATYRTEQDVFSAFLEEHCELIEHANEAAGALLERFNASVSTSRASQRQSVR